jgi:hypothetical protein
LTYKATPAGGIDDPRGALDFLFGDGLITRREYDAGLTYARCFRSCDPRCGAILDHLDERLDRIELDRHPFLRRVAVQHKRPVGVEGLKRLRHTLAMVALELDQIEIG